MFQVLHLDVSKVDRVLYMGSGRERKRSPCGATSRWRGPRMTVQNAGASGRYPGSVGPTWTRNGGAETDYSHEHFLDVQLLVVAYFFFPKLGYRIIN
jgi:hypothetical protein